MKTKRAEIKPQLARESVVPSGSILKVRRETRSTLPVEALGERCGQEVVESMDVGGAGGEKGGENKAVQKSTRTNM